MKTCKKGLHQYEPGKGCPECSKAYRKTYQQVYPDSHDIANKRWQKANLSRVNAATAKYKAAKLNATPKWLTQLHFDQIQIFYDSATALTKELGIPFEVDHIVPLRGEFVSGLHVPWNLQVLTKPENQSKGNR